MIFFSPFIFFRFFTKSCMFRDSHTHTHTGFLLSVLEIWPLLKLKTIFPHYVLSPFVVWLPSRLRFLTLRLLIITTYHRLVFNRTSPHTQLFGVCLHTITPFHRIVVNAGMAKVATNLIKIITINSSVIFAISRSRFTNSRDVRRRGDRETIAIN